MLQKLWRRRCDEIRRFFQTQKPKALGVSGSHREGTERFTEAVPWLGGGGGSRSAGQKGRPHTHSIARFVYRCCEWTYIPTHGHPGREEGSGSTPTCDGSADVSSSSSPPYSTAAQQQRSHQQGQEQAVSAPPSSTTSSPLSCAWLRLGEHGNARSERDGGGASTRAGRRRHRHRSRHHHRKLHVLHHSG